MRKWTNTSGKTIEAGLELASDTKVKLKLKNGKTAVVELSTLSQADRDYVKKWLANNATPQGFGKPDVEIVITTLAGAMKYDKVTFNVPPGAKVKLVLKNNDEMHHNLVICTAGKGNDLEVAKEAWKLAGDGFEKHWIPEHPKLLFASRMADPHSSATLYFTAPKQLGTYPYVCTLPGHATLMKGEMIVGTGSGSATSFTDLKFVLYKGGWKKLPDFAKLEPAATDHVESGLIDLGIAKDVKGGFAVVFTGKLNVPEDGEYAFKLGSDDGSRLTIDGSQVIDHDGIHGMQTKDGKVRLRKGPRDIEVAYFDGGGQRALFLEWSGPGVSGGALSPAAAKKGGSGMKTGIPLAPTETEAILYRNFIAGGGSRAIGVGYPGGMNLAFDADTIRIAMVWQGAFIDAARHWQGRGQGEQPPLGDAILNFPKVVPFAVLGSDFAPWPDDVRKKSTQRPDNGYVFKGYELSSEGRFPTFRYTFNGLKVTDAPMPTGSMLQGNVALKRTLTLKGEAPSKLYYLSAIGKSIEKQSDGRYLVDGDLWIALRSAGGGPPVVRDLKGNKELVIGVPFKNGVGAVEETNSWY